MKKNLIIHFILVLLLKIGVTGCTEETISMNADRMPDETAMDNIAGALRNTTTLTNKAFIELTEGDESATEEIFTVTISRKQVDCHSRCKREACRRL